MDALFLKIVNMSIAASWLILAVVLLRVVLNKAPKWINVLLWGIVVFRLICPFSFESALSLIPSAETISPEIMMDWTPEISTGVSSIDKVVNPIITDTFTPEPIVSANPLQLLIPVLAIVWAIGIVAMLVYAAVSYLRLQKKVGASFFVGDNIWICDDIQTPFILGVFRPRIYIPSGTDEAQLPHIIAHENAHLKRRDHWWKPMGFLALSIHWFNPLVWVAYLLLCRDIELACDEKVIRDLNQSESISYSEALLSCSVNRRTILVCPLAFGEVGVKERVKRVLNYKKPAFWIVVVAIIAAIVTAVCFLTNPKTIGDSITLVEQSTPGNGNTFTYDTTFGQSVMSGTVYAEQWSNGTCTKSSPAVLTSEVDEINILLDVRRENGHSVGVDIQVDTNEHGGSFITYFAFPENYSILGWSCNGYELNKPILIQSEAEKILAAMVFDVGNGVRVFSPEVLVNEPERLENVDYAIVIRASFDSTNLDNENSEHNSHSADGGAVIPMVMVNDTLYLYTGFENTDAHHDVMNGKITSSVRGNTKPTVNDQSNFGEGYAYQYGAAEGTIEIYMDGKWCIFATEEVRQDIQFPVADGDVNGSNGAESGETTPVVAGVSMVDASKIASIAVTNGNTGEQKTVTGKKAYSEEYYFYNDLRKLYGQLDFSVQAVENERVGYQYSMVLYDVEGNKLQRVTPYKDGLTVDGIFYQYDGTGEGAKASLNLMEYMEYIFTPETTPLQK